MFFRLGSRREWRVRLVGLILLVSICASFFPLPAGSRPVGGKDRSAPYPCRDRPCGCRSADQCWKRCCCFSNSQKLAWAKANGVVAPDYVTLAASGERETKDCQTGGCSSHRRPKSRTDRPENSPHDSSESDDSAPVYVLAIMAHHCQGTGLFWNSLPCAVIPTSAVLVRPVREGAWETTPAPKPPDCSEAPPEPPPRAADQSVV
jgi:hypothetical protein